MTRALAIAAMVLLLLQSGLSWSVGSPCIDYGSFSHYSSVVPMTVMPRDVALAGHFAYLVMPDSTLRVLDLQAPNHPHFVSDTALPTSADKVFILGTLAILAGNGVSVADISDPPSPYLLGSVMYPGECIALAAEDNVVAVLNNDLSLVLIDISNSSSPTIAQTLSFSQTYASDVFLSDGLAFVLTYDTIDILDVHNPYNPILLSRYSFFRDFESYPAIYACAHHIYLSINSELCVLDVQDPSSPHLVATIPAFGSFLYAPPSQLYVQNYQLDVFDITVPSQPVLLYSIPNYNVYQHGASETIIVSQLGSFNGLGVYWLADNSIPPLSGVLHMPADNDALSLSHNVAVIAKSKTSIAIVSMAEPEHIEELGQLDLGSTIAAIATSGQYFYVVTTAYPKGYLFVVDVSTPSAPYVVSRTGVGWYTDSIEITSGRAYISGFDGVLGFPPTVRVCIYDLANPAQPRFLTWMYYDYYADGYVGSVAAQDSVMYAALPYALSIVDCSLNEGASPRELARVPMLNCRGLAFDSGRVYGAVERGLKIIDVSVPSSPSIIETIDLPSAGTDVSLINGYAYVSMTSGGIAIVDIDENAGSAIAGIMAPERSCGTLEASNAVGIVGRSVDDLIVGMRMCGGEVPTYTRYFLAKQEGREVVASWGIGGDCGDTRFVLEGSRGAEVWGVPACEVRECEFVARDSIEKWATGSALVYTLTACHEGGGCETVGNREVLIRAGSPGSLAIRTVHPNPFNGGTEIDFELPLPGHIQITVYDQLGRRVRSLISGMFAAGPHSVQWDGLDDAGRVLASGVYYLRLSADSDFHVSKVLLVR